MSKFNEDILISFCFTYTNYEKVQLRPPKNWNESQSYMPNLARGPAINSCCLWSLFFNPPTKHKTPGQPAGQVLISWTSCCTCAFCIVHQGWAAPKWCGEDGDCRGLWWWTVSTALWGVCVFLCWLNKKGVICQFVESLELPKKIEKSQNLWIKLICVTNWKGESSFMGQAALHQPFIRTHLSHFTHHFIYSFSLLSWVTFCSNHHILSFWHNSWFLGPKNSPIPVFCTGAPLQGLGPPKRLAACKKVAVLEYLDGSSKGTRSPGGWVLVGALRLFVVRVFWWSDFARFPTWSIGW